MSGDPLHPKSVVGWRVWYDDGVCYTNKTTEWEDLPKDGVLMLVVYFADGSRRVSNGADYYFKARGHNGSIYGHDMMLPTPDRYEDLVLLRGRWGDDIMMSKVESEALDALEKP